MSSTHRRDENDFVTLVQGSIRFDEVHIKRKTQVFQIRLQSRMLKPYGLNGLLNVCSVGQVERQAVGTGFFPYQGE